MASMTHEQASKIVEAAAALLARIDSITTEDFSKGGERPQREALRAALADAGIPVNV